MLLTLAAVYGLFTLTVSAQPIALSPVPGWVEPIQPVQRSAIPTQEIKNGIYYLLADTQLTVPAQGAQQRFEHYASLVMNTRGLEDAGQITIHFDPLYQQLQLHQLNIIRDGISSSRYSQARISLVQTEQDLQKLLYYGKTALNIVLPDVRVGDIVQYSYSLTGSNPVFADRFNHSQSLNWSVPLHQQHWRLIWQKPEPLYYRFSQQPLPLRITSSAEATIYQLTQTDVAVAKVEDDTPDWYSPYNTLSLSNSEQWQDIAQWGSSLFEPAISNSRTVTEKVARWQLEHATAEQQIIAALLFVQTDIRYLGIELGESSHKPASAEQVLLQRYGDCKDKSVLLVSMLRQLGHQAVPVLVNTERAAKIADVLPSAHAFDHAIVKLEFNNTTYWLDPTRSHQGGPLSTLYQPDYGVALELAKGVNQLTSMSSARQYTKTLINDHFQLTDSLSKPANYTVSTLYSGLAAERVRSQFARNSLNQKEEDYTQFYSRYYATITQAAPIIKTDDRAQGTVKIDEFYLISDFWDSEDNHKFSANFYTNGISSYLEQPKIAANRSQPFAIDHPVDIEQTLTIQLNDVNWQFEEETVQELNPFFQYQSQVQFDKATNTLTLNYQYKSLTDHILPEQRSDYLAAVSRAREDLHMGLVQNTQATTEVDDMADTSTILAILFICSYAMLCLICIALWLLDPPPIASEQHFPEPVVRFILTWLVTFSLFGLYWCLKNGALLNKAKAQQSALP
ncbi:DUF3857 domain-containing transglutaminase family protein [Arsukibacterium sp.]|uniref:DUF3857 domain-containing transglutaminase family protein n=1 Tax=Arsukibacterium sp. TaxID=1977258 RepID=UPI002FD8E457